MDHTFTLLLLITFGVSSGGGNQSQPVECKTEKDLKLYKDASSFTWTKCFDCTDATQKCWDCCSTKKDSPTSSSLSTWVIVVPSVVVVVGIAILLLCILLRKSHFQANRDVEAVATCLLLKTSDAITCTQDESTSNNGKIVAIEPHDVEAVATCLLLKTSDAITCTQDESTSNDTRIVAIGPHNFTINDEPASAMADEEASGTK